MKTKSRILSISVISILLLAACIVVIVVAKSNTDKPQYATSIEFASISGSVEMYIDNKLIIHEDLVEVSPLNCTFKPEFTIKKSGNSESVSVTAGGYVFSSSGKYTLECKVKSSKSNYIKDSIIITVVDTPSENTVMYIKSLPIGTFYIDDKLNINEIIETKHPSSAEIRITCSENIEYKDGEICAKDCGFAKVEIRLIYDGIIIVKDVELNIMPKLNKEDFEFKLSVGGSVLETNKIQVNISQFNFVINYELLYMDDEQEILCWTTGESVEIISFNAPTIIFKTLNTGETIIYVSPLDYPSVVFEILVSIV